MRLSLYVYHLAGLACLLALAGCDWQTPWSREYHLRQYEEWRTMGDRARVNASYATSKSYYQNSLDELGRTAAKPARLAQAMQDIAETDLLSNNLDEAVPEFEKALQLYKTQNFSAAENYGYARCLTGYGVALLKKDRLAEASSILAEAVRKNVELSASGRRRGEPLQSLACGWSPQLCEHSGKFWLLSCRDPLLKRASSKSELLQLLQDSSLCGPVKQLAATAYGRLLRVQHEEIAARRVEEDFGILEGLDTPEAALVQRNWESLSKQGKKFEENGNYTEARLAYEKALKIADKTIPECPVRRLSSLCNLAFFYLTSGNLKAAIPLLKECVDIQQARFGDSDRALALPRSRLGRALLANGQAKEAEPEIRMGYELALKGYGKDSQFTARSECMLAALETVEKNFADAEKHLIHALSIMTKGPQRNERTIFEAKLNLLDIYKNTRDPEQILHAANDVASFALENGSYVEQVQALERLALICREQNKKQDEQNALQQEKEVINDALPSPKWKRWAEKRMKILNAELSQPDSSRRQRGQP